jgi:hypothetical protein
MKPHGEKVVLTESSEYGAAIMKRCRCERQNVGCGEVCDVLPGRVALVLSA